MVVNPRRAQGALCPGRALLLVLALALAGCGAAQGDAAPRVPGANADRGRALLAVYGCGACHVIPGVHDARGLLGPPLTDWRGRAFVAGVLPNQPAALERWLMTPQAVVPGNAMPDMGVTPSDAADIAAYLYTIQ